MKRVVVAVMMMRYEIEMGLDYGMNVDVRFGLLLLVEFWMDDDDDEDDYDL